MDPALREAVLASQNIQAPASPLGASNAPEIAKFSQASFQAPLARAATYVQTQNSQAIAAQRAQAEKIAAQKQQDLADFKAYKVVKKEDGGFDFVDPNGQKVDIATVTQRTGASPVDILKSSENPIDIQYVQDYNNLQDFIQSILSGNTKKKDEYIAAAKQSGIDLSQYNTKDGINKLIGEFRQAYQRYYTPNYGASVPENPTVPYPQAGGGVGTPNL